MRISDSLAIREEGNNKVISCGACNQIVAPAGEPWKSRAPVIEIPMQDWNKRYTAADGVILRRFICSGCGVLLDSEIAVAGDPYLDDILF